VKPVLLDTGFIVALLNKNDASHLLCSRFHDTLDRQFVTCEPVIVESCYLLRNAPGAIEVILRNVAEGIFEIPVRLASSAIQIRVLLEKYRDLPASLADVALVHMADELDTGEILTLDRHFIHYRWRRTRAFHMLIPLD